MSNTDSFTMHDHEELTRAQRAGHDLGSTVRVTYFFSSPGAYPAQAIQALRSLGIDDIVVDEEVTGDSYWHVAAFGACVLSPAAISEANAAMASIAAQACVEYDGWRVTLMTGEARDLLHTV